MNIPSFFEPHKCDKVWCVPYQQRAEDARQWAQRYNISPAATDKTSVGLLLIDVQNTFCLPGFELFVPGAVEDNIRLCQFIYRNLGKITDIIPTMDTHTAISIFHAIFWLDAQGKNPTPATVITYEQVITQFWRPNPSLLKYLGLASYEALQNYALHYVKKLQDDGKYPLTIWPYHSMLGGIGHALVPAVEEAIFFHSIARNSMTSFELKGSHSLTENYSVLAPEVKETHEGKELVPRNSYLIDRLLTYDTLIITGQAKSHCVAWTIQHILEEILQRDPDLVKKVFLLVDCTSPVVVPNIVDFTAEADAAFMSFAHAGMHLVKSTDIF